MPTCCPPTVSTPLHPAQLAPHRCPAVPVGTGTSRRPSLPTHRRVPKFSCSASSSKRATRIPNFGYMIVHARALSKRHIGRGKREKRLLNPFANGRVCQRRKRITGLARWIEYFHLPRQSRTENNKVGTVGSPSRAARSVQHLVASQALLKEALTRSEKSRLTGQSWARGALGKRMPKWKR